MPIYSMDELNELANTSVKCPLCVSGPPVKGWDKAYVAEFSRVWFNKVVAKDKDGQITMNIFERIIPCERHGKVIVEVEL